MKVKKTSLKDVPFKTAPNRQIAELLSASASGAQGVTFRIVDLVPRSQQMPRRPHSHATFEETMYVLHGTGRLWAEGETYEMQEGDALLVPPGVYHAVVNLTEEPLRLACFFPVPENVGVDLVEQEGILITAEGAEAE